jgi:hypothetical protein
VLRSASATASNEVDAYTRVTASAGALSPFGVTAGLTVQGETAALADIQQAVGELQLAAGVVTRQRTAAINVGQFAAQQQTQLVALTEQARKDASKGGELHRGHFVLLQCRLS